MEARIARLEADVTHLLSGVTDIKADVRGLRDRMDVGHAKLTDRIDGTANKLNEKIDAVQHAAIGQLAACAADCIPATCGDVQPRPRI